VRVLLDENVSPIIGDTLRAAGYDVLLAATARPGAPDDGVVALAVAEARVLITEDKDFGELAFQQGLHPAGVIRLALPRELPAEKAQRLVETLHAHVGLVQGNMLVVEPARVRSRPLKS
jgi:predicted nuclease of predicted toxin-antitoxin system